MGSKGKGKGKPKKDKLELRHVATGRMTSKLDMTPDIKQRLKEKYPGQDMKLVGTVTGRTPAGKSTTVSQQDKDLPKTQYELFTKLVYLANIEIQRSPVVDAETGPRVATAITTYLVGNKLVNMES